MSGAGANVRPPIPSNVSKPKVYLFAEQIAKRLAVAPGDVLEALVSRLGGRMAYQNGSGENGDPPPSILVKSLRDFTIYIPTMTSVTRDRFSIAHELGHLFLHFPMVQKAAPGSYMRATRWVDSTDPEQQRAEWEANWFAAGFLMPEADFKNVWSQNRALAAVADRFGVSQQAASYRQRSLGLT